MSSDEKRYQFLCDVTSTVYITSLKGPLKLIAHVHIISDSYTMQDVASFPGLPRFFFFVLRFAFSRKQKSAKNGEGLGTPVT